MNYITYICSGSFVDNENIEISKQIILLGKKIIEDDEWAQGFIDFDILQKFIVDNSVDNENKDNVIVDKITFEKMDGNVIFLKEEMYVDNGSIPTLSDTKYIFVCNDYTFV